MKKYIAPEIELIRFLGIDVLASSKVTTPKMDVDDDGWINHYPTRPTRPH
ncbi:MAG: hypothetical protein IKE65_00090 [Clostridia bacterium]|nr:hypothetical protein [Clostridia bacterium]